ncbi:thymidine kinase [Silvanigrella aquatica]|uniref:Thymidine kinase n=1 Tax=Silvanigrella aquatica TaxID=1915309 RepID=A0A1L4D0A1_9BACT|nr:thymidine kinase [Silvanigrella aquatica]APJ03619.1 thymidine kinase [Silvanigrella aquatica]
MLRKNDNGVLEVICGCMFSGKTEELIRVLKRAIIAKQKVLVFKHASDIRYSHEELYSHNGQKITSHLISNTKEIFSLDLDEVDVIGIDEAQFFSDDILEHVELLMEKGIRVIAAGLDLDYRRKPFGCMPQLLAMANKVTKLSAICVQCNDEAHYSQRLIHNNQIVLVGAADSYEPRCRKHHKIT